MSQRTKNVAILGGGMAALACAYRLTDPECQGRFNVTIYQIGWRLGGKGASGRNRHYANRIEEHGLHVWMGFYHQAFRLIRDAYTELARRGLRAPDAPLATWDQAFKPHNLIVVAEQLRSRWGFWKFPFPQNDELPGETAQPSWPTPSSYLQMSRDLLKRGARAMGRCVAPRKLRHTLPRWVRRGLGCGRALLGRDRDTFESLLDDDPTLRRWLVFAEFVLVNTRGLLQDLGVHGMSLDDLDDLDYREWLEQHGATKYLLESSGLRGMYDMSFAYQNGDLDQPDFAAGVFLRFFARMFLGYKGSVFWKMQGGMGDVVFTPLYEVLRARGVQFRFFHRVDDIQLDPKEQEVKTIQMTVQAEPKGDCYEPLMDVDGLACWPSEPLWEQLDDADARRRDGNLEAARTAGLGRRIHLERGEDFDEVVLGISVAALPRICRDLLDRNPAFANMCREVKTTATQAAQLWFCRDQEELGWTTPPCVLDAYGDAMNTWADMTHVAQWESWPRDTVRHIAYFCGPYKSASYADCDTPTTAELARDLQDVQNAFAEVCQTGLAGLWPQATTPQGDPKGALRWDWLIAPSDCVGKQRLDHQYIRCNTEPTERYVLSARGSTAFRLRQDETGIRNLVFTGDWTRTSLNYGCIEAATESGIRAAQALKLRTSAVGAQILSWTMPTQPAAIKLEAS